MKIKKLLKVILPSITALLVAVNFNVLAVQGQGGFEPVTLCHTTESEDNPYVEITVDNQGQLNGHQNHEDDIIPAPEEGCPDEDEDNEEEEDGEEASPSPDPTSSPSPQTQTGSITVCKVVIDSNGNVVNGSAIPGVTFSISGINPAQNSQPAPVGTIGTSNFTTPLSLNSDIFAGVPGSDAQCQTYSNLAMGNYYWGQESISPQAGWSTPKYNDQHLTPVAGVADFYSYDSNLFDGNLGNDASRNTNADGHIVLYDQRPNRTLVVLNQYAAQGGEEDPSPSPDPTPSPSPSPNTDPSPSPSPSTGGTSETNTSSSTGQVQGSSTTPQVLAATGNSKSNIGLYLGVLLIALGLWRLNFLRLSRWS